MFPPYDEVISNLSEETAQLEQQRADILRRVKRHGLISLLIVLAIIVGSLLVDKLIVIGLIGLFIYVIIAVILLARKYKSFRAAFKQRIVWGMAREMLRLCRMPFATERYRYECRYSPRERISDHLIQESRLFNYSIDKIRGEDLFHGILGLTEFKFSELTLIQTRTSTDSKGHTTHTDVTMFDGILFTADFHKDFSGVTILHSANVFNTGRIGRMLRPLQHTLSLFAREKKRAISLENEDFNRAFHVQTTDDLTARYILTSSMMERLLNFKQTHPGKIEISFVHSSMYVAISSNKNYFEPKLADTIVETQGLAVYEDLKFLFGMIEEFDLNTRIWNKP